MDVRSAPDQQAPAGRATADAEEALRLVFVDPERSRAAGRAARRRARRVGDTGAEVIAERALGLAGKELQDLRAAAHHLRRAVDLADRAGLDVAAAEARMSLALVRALQGDTAGSQELGAAAGRVLRGLPAARLEMQLALIAQRAGRFDEALAGYERSLSVFRREGDKLWQAKLLNNRGVMHAFRGRPRLAAADLNQAAALYEALDQHFAVADVRWNLGFVAGRSGAVVDALVHFAEAERYYTEHGLAKAALLLDKCEVLLLAGLFREAWQTARLAVAELTRRRMTVDLAEARLVLAQAALACGELDDAQRAARHAGRAFDRQGRAAWGAVARYVSVRVAWIRGRRRRLDLRAALDSAAELDRAGWTIAALDARLIAARLAIHLGDLDEAGRLLTEVTALRRRGVAAARVSAWHATALLRLAAGDRPGAETALRAGLRCLDQYRWTLGATELRVLAAAHGAELITTGLSLAAATGRASRLLAWAEHGRARSLQMRPGRPPAEEELADDLAELRAVTAEREQALAAGQGTAALARRQAALEQSIRDRWRRSAGDAAAAHRTVTPQAVARRLDGRVLVEFTEVDGCLRAIVVTGRRTTLPTLGPVAAVATELRSLRFSLRRIAAGRADSGQSTVEALKADAEALDELLLRPLRREIGGSPLVIVPTGVLHGVPWSLLPGCAGRPVSVAPSAQAWLRAAESPALVADRTVLIAGPGLPAAAGEISALAAAYPGARSLVGSRATVADALTAMDGANCVHLAAHGRFRDDNPQFSALTMADGPLTVFDLERLQRPPRLVVLSACDSGVSAVHGGDELMGFAAALLAVGCTALIATVVPVLDTSAEQLMVALHAGLRAGNGPAAALAAAQQAAASTGEAAAFVCYGAG